MPTTQKIQNKSVLSVISNEAIKTFKRANLAASQGASKNHETSQRTQIKSPTKMVCHKSTVQKNSIRENSDAIYARHPYGMKPNRN